MLPPNMKYTSTLCIKNLSDKVTYVVSDNCVWLSVNKFYII